MVSSVSLRFQVSFRSISSHQHSNDYTNFFSFVLFSLSSRRSSCWLFSSIFIRSSLVERTQRISQEVSFAFGQRWQVGNKMVETSIKEDATCFSIEQKEFELEFQEHSGYVWSVSIQELWNGYHILGNESDFVERRLKFERSGMVVRLFREIARSQ